jgi:RND family efflux transporter MFP subunit
LATGKNEVAGLGGTSVRLKLLDETEFSHSARMDFVDNVVDRASGTIRGRAQLENPDNLFTPGMFARVQVPASAPYQALMVPDAAIGSEQARKFVYLIDQDNVARLRYVTLGQLVDDLRVIKEGLSAGDRVVVNGLMRVRQGVKVTPEERPASPQASVPARATADKTD